MSAKYTPRRPRENRLCPQCGGTFSVQAARPKTFCTVACRQTSTTRIVRVCPVCGHNFLAKPSVVAVGRGIFCSNPCYRTSTRRPTVPCLECGTPIVSYGARKFCSRRCAGAYQARGTLEGFWRRVRKTDDCWEYTGLRDRDGYGLFPRNNKHVPAHVIAWELTYGPPPTGLESLHGCDNPPCVRPHPSHVHFGTHAENMAEAAARNRFRTGPSWRAAHRACIKLTPDDVRAIRTRYATGGISFLQLALEYAVGKSTIESLLKRKTWADID